MIICIWLHIITFTCTKLFPILLEIVDLYGCMIIFGTGSTLGAIFVVFVLEETAGKSLDDVELNMAADNQRNSISKS